MTAMPRLGVAAIVSRTRDQSWQKEISAQQTKRNVVIMRVEIRLIADVVVVVVVVVVVPGYLVGLADPITRMTNGSLEPPPMPLEAAGLEHLRRHQLQTSGLRMNLC
jgi:hypothetical protein